MAQSPNAAQDQAKTVFRSSNHLSICSGTHSQGVRGGGLPSRVEERLLVLSALHWVGMSLGGPWGQSAAATPLTARPKAPLTEMERGAWGLLLGSFLRGGSWFHLESGLLCGSGLQRDPATLFSWRPPLLLHSEPNCLETALCHSGRDWTLLAS